MTAVPAVSVVRLVRHVAVDRVADRCPCRRPSTVTSAVYQPLLPSVPAGVSVAAGAVLSSLTVTAGGLGGQARPLVHDPLKDLPVVSVVWC